MRNPLKFPRSAGCLDHSGRNFMTSTSGTVQTFADCLREIIAENGWTLDVLAEATGYKSKTSVSRILREESSAKNREHFLEQLRQSKLLRPEELDRLQSALEVSALGADKVCARQVLLDLILGQNAGPGALPEDFAALLDAFHTADEGRLLLINGMDSVLLAPLRDVLAQNRGVALRHYFSIGSSALCAAKALRQLSRMAFLPNYTACANDSEFALGALAGLPDVLIASIRRPDGSTEDSLTVFSAPSRASTFRLPGEYGLCSYLERAFSPISSQCAPITQVCSTSNGPEGFVSVMQFWADCERDREMYHVKSDLCLNQIPTSIVRAALNERALSAAFPGVPSGELHKLLERFLYYQLLRYRNMDESRAARHLIMSMRGLSDFARTGLLSEHFGAMRPFTPSERRAALEKLLARAVKNKQFFFYLYKDGFEPKVEIDCWGSYGLTAFPLLRRRAATDNYCNNLILHPYLVNTFQEYFQNGLCGRYTLPVSDSIAWLRALIGRAFPES